jgi:hypothetical protein
MGVKKPDSSSDDLFVVICKDRAGLFHAGSPDYPAGSVYNHTGVDAITAHMAGFGYRQVDVPPWLLLHGEMTVIKHQL